MSLSRLLEAISERRKRESPAEKAERIIHARAEEAEWWREEARWDDVAGLLGRAMMESHLNDDVEAVRWLRKAVRAAISEGIVRETAIQAVREAER